jgi:glycosyltransferase involved in cell wall biosynthesis
MIIFSWRAKNKVLKGFKASLSFKISGPLVSIIVPAFNEEDYLPNCLKSIKNQTYQNIEIIVADNLSTDKTPKIAKEFGAKLVRVKQKNASVVRNEGAKSASSKILFFIDADCILENFYVEKMVKELSDKVVLSHGGICCYDSEFHNFLWTFNRWFKPHVYTSGRNGACLWKKTFWEIGGYNENLNPLEGYREDLDLGKRILKKFGLSSIKYCPSVLIGTSSRREKVFGYPFWKFPAAWKKGIRGVREGKVIY